MEVMIPSPPPFLPPLSSCFLWRNIKLSTRPSLVFSAITEQYPGIPLGTLKSRYATMKAKTTEWTPEAVSPPRVFR